MGDRYKKYLRRMAFASVMAAALCLASLVPATYALFQVSMETGGSLVQVGSFAASNETVVQASTLGLEDPTVIPEGQTCPEGRYYLDLKWKGDADGHIAFTVAPPVGTDGQPVSATAAKKYVFNLPLNSDVLYTGDPAAEHTVRIPLVLYEPAVVTTSSTWGLYTPAEGEDTFVLSMDNIVYFVEAGGISFGIPFESSAVAKSTDEKYEYPISSEGVEMIPGEYTLTLDWTPQLAGYCVLEVSAADKNSKTEAQKLILKLPQVEEAEGENVVITIPLILRENAIVSAEAFRGTSIDAVEWAPVLQLAFGTACSVNSYVDSLPVAADQELTSLKEEAYAAGKYQLKLDWTAATADGYCVITVGEESWYVPVSVAEEAQRTRFFMLDLLKDAVVTVKAEKGELPEGKTAFEGDTIVYGAVVSVNTLLAAQPAGEEAPVFAPLSVEKYPVGTYQLKLNWSGSNVDGYCVVFVGSETYYISCPKADETRQRVITLQLLKEASISVITGIGAVPADVTALTEDSVVCGAIFTGGVSLAVKPAGEEEPQYFELDPKKVQEIGEYKLSLVPNWAASTVSGHILITVTAPSEGEEGEPITAIWYLPCAVDQAPRVLDLILQKGATVKVEFIRGDFAGTGLTVPADGKLTFPVPGEHTGE